MLIAAFLSHVLYVGPNANDNTYLVIACLGGALIGQTGYAQGAYRFEAMRQLGRQLRMVVTGVAIAMVLLVALEFFLHLADQWARGWILLWAGLTLGGLGLSRVIVSRGIRQLTASGVLTQNVVLLGADWLCAQFETWVERHPGSGIRILAVFDDRASRRSEAKTKCPHIVGGINELLEFVKRESVDTVILALPGAAYHRTADLLEKVRQAPVDVRVLIDLIGFEFANRPISHICGLPTIHLAEKPIKDWQAVVKSIEDRSLAFLLTLLFGPLMLMLALAIKLESPGPVFYRQMRMGFNNIPFKVWKFRTMRYEATSSSVLKLTQRHDPRVTRVGAILRKTSLDEIPQLFNVLAGDMSLVGPRPHALNATAADIVYDKAVATYAARHRVKPGITGWAQVNGWRGPTETIEQIERRVEHDLYYIDHWSPLFDMWILVLTAFKGFIDRNAF